MVPGRDRTLRIEPFGVEMWMNAHEGRCELNLAETCIHSLTLRELTKLARCSGRPLDGLMDTRLTYGAIKGSDGLRQAIAATYADHPADGILVTHGTAGANMLVHRALIEPGDVVVAVCPTYQQHCSIPESLGGEVREVWLREAQGWSLNMDELEAAAQGARLIALTNPNNPTGAALRRPEMETLAGIAERAGCWLLVDEVYRGLEQGEPVPSVADLTDLGISTCGMSKAYGLAGLRLGWIAGPPDVLAAAAVHRDYDTISVGMVDDHLATIALQARDAVLGRSRALIAVNRLLLGEWAVSEPSVRCVVPDAGTTALLRYDIDLPSEALCLALLDETGVLLAPGAAMGMEGYLRVGAGCEPGILREGLARLSGFLARRRAVDPERRRA